MWVNIPAQILGIGAMVSLFLVYPQNSGLSRQSKDQPEGKGENNGEDTF